MLTVRDLMTEDLVTVSPSYTLREAAEAMAAEHVSGLPVVEDGTAVGVISATDVMTFATGGGGSAGGSRGSPRGRVGRGAGAGPEIPSGYYTEEWRTRPYEADGVFPDSDRPEWNVLEEHTVSEFMTRALISLAPDAGAQEAAATMVGAGVRRLLVVDVDRLAGLISSTDLLEAVAERGIAG